MYTKLYIPKNPTLDVASSAWLISTTQGINEENIIYVPATWSGVDMLDSDVSIGLNATLAENGLHIRYGNKSGHMKSCFSVCLEMLPSKSYGTFISLSNYISSLLTSKGPWGKAKNLGFNPNMIDMNYMYDSLRTWFSKGENEESELLLMWFEVMDAYRNKQLAHVKASEIADEIDMKEVGGLLIACVENTDEIPAQAISRQMFFKNADFVIYKEGSHVGIIRSREVLEPDLNELKHLIDEEDWYFYPSGTMASRGTRSRPIDTPSKYTLEDLESMLEKVITTKLVEL
jgi:hypothetical protein